MSGPGNYGANYSGNYADNYAGNYGANYSGNYGENYGGNYAGNYPGNSSGSSNGDGDTMIRVADGLGGCNADDQGLWYFFRHAEGSHRLQRTGGTLEATPCVWCPQ